MTGWYCVHTLPRAEATALANLRRQGFEAWLPRYRRARRHARRTDQVAAPLFPGYLFLALDPATTPWRAINGTFGCRYLICHGDRPAALPPGFVAGLRAEADIDGFLPARDPLARLMPGDAVRIIEGPLGDLVGRLQALSDSERVILLLDVLGRQVRVTLPRTAVDAA